MLQINTLKCSGVWNGYDEKHSNLPIIKRISATQRDEIRDKTGRPMRTTARAEQIANRTVMAAATLHDQFYRSILKLLPTSGTPEQFDLQRAMFDGEYKAMTDHGIHCDCGEPHQGEKELTPDQIARINREFANLIGTTENFQFDQAALDWLKQLFGLDASVSNATPMKAGYFDMMLDSYKWAFKTLERTYQREAKRSSVWARDNAFNVYAIGEINPASPFVQKIYTDGFNLISSKITKQFAPELKQYITKQVGLGTSWTDISRNITQQFNQGKLWHWQRLVRTEMSLATHQATIEQYTEAGIEYVKWSASPTRCPICAEIADSTGGYSMLGTMGYYRLESAPNVTGDTHPNCRCLVMSQWRLPRTIEDYFIENKI